MHYTGKFPKTDEKRLAKNVFKDKQKDKIYKWKRPIAIASALFIGMIALVQGNNNFLSGQIVRQIPVTLTPVPGAYVLDSEDNGLEVGMFTTFGGDIWYTTDGSSPVRGNWIHSENPNLRHYDGIPLVLSKSGAVSVVAISPVTMQITPVQRMNYSISRKASQAPKPVVQAPTVKYIIPFVMSNEPNTPSGIKRHTQYGLR